MRKLMHAVLRAWRHSPEIPARSSMDGGCAMPRNIDTFVGDSRAPRR